MPITALPYRVYNELENGFKAKERPIRRWREDIKDTSQQHDLTVNDATRQARISKYLQITSTSEMQGASAPVKSSKRTTMTEITSY
jgi:hypothetical protein